MQVYRGGDLYEGEFVNDEREGDGSCAFAMGTVYNGQWEQGKRHGEGREVTPANDIYEGQWEGGCMAGNGKLEYSSGAVYIGTWQAIHGPTPHPAPLPSHFPRQSSAPSPPPLYHSPTPTPL